MKRKCAAVLTSRKFPKHAPIACTREALEGKSWCEKHNPYFEAIARLNKDIVKVGTQRKPRR